MSRAIKSYRRSFAGDVVEPVDVRNPAALVKTSTYIFDQILDADRRGPDPRFDDDNGQPRAPTLLEVQKFCWNRLRSVVKDWTAQNYGDGARNDAWVQETMERIVRCSLMFNYECCTYPEEFIPVLHMNEEQISSQMKMLVELYDDARR